MLKVRIENKKENRNMLVEEATLISNDRKTQVHRHDKIDYMKNVHKIRIVKEKTRFTNASVHTIRRLSDNQLS